QTYLFVAEHPFMMYEFGSMGRESEKDRSRNDLGDGSDGEDWVWSYATTCGPAFAPITIPIDTIRQDTIPKIQPPILPPTINISKKCDTWSVTEFEHFSGIRRVTLLLDSPHVSTNVSTFPSLINPRGATGVAFKIKVNDPNK